MVRLLEVAGTRDSDDGVHEEARHTLQQLRGEISARIRRAVYPDPIATRQDGYTDERAARIGETVQIP